MSARVVVNPVSMRMENERITQLLKEIKAVYIGGKCHAYHKAYRGNQKRPSGEIT